MALAAAACNSSGGSTQAPAGAAAPAASQPATADSASPSGPGVEPRPPAPPASVPPSPPQPSAGAGTGRAPGSSDAKGAARPADAQALAAGDTARPAPAAPPAPRYREFTIPAGTEVAVTLETALASDTSRLEEAVRAAVRRPIVLDDHTVVPSGTVVHGSVVDVAASGKVKGRARLGVRFTDLVLDDERIPIETAAITREAQSTKGKDAKKVGIPAAGGAVLGAIIGGGKGAAIGATVGGGAGAAVVMSTKGAEVRLPAGTALTVRLREPVTVRVRL
jgi:hypothetical protein